MNKMIMQDKAKKAQMAAEKAEAQAIAEKLKGVMVKFPPRRHRRPALRRGDQQGNFRGPAGPV